MYSFMVLTLHDAKQCNERQDNFSCPLLCHLVFVTDRRYYHRTLSYIPKLQLCCVMLEQPHCSILKRSTILWQHFVTVLLQPKRYSHRFHCLLMLWIYEGQTFVMPWYNASLPILTQWTLSLPFLHKH